jgi:hypothetical protein
MKKHVLSAALALLLGGAAPAQGYRVLGHWDFEQEPWRKPAQGERQMTGGNGYGRAAGGGICGSYLRVGRKQAGLAGLVWDNSGAFALEFWFRYPEYDYNPSNAWFWVGDQSLLIRWHPRFISFQTKVRDHRSGKIESDAFQAPLTGEGRRSRGYYLDGQWHHMVFKYDPWTGQKEIWVDGELPAGFSTSVSARGPLCGNDPCNTGSLMFSEYVNGVSEFIGDLDELIVYQGFPPADLHVQHYRDLRAGRQRVRFEGFSSEIPPAARAAGPAWDPADFAPGHPGVSLLPAEQLRQFPLPRYRPGHSLLPLFNWMGMDYVGMQHIAGVKRADAARQAAAVQEELALHWHYAIALQNIGTYLTTRELRDSTRFTGAYVRLANRYPDLPLSLSTYWAGVRMDYGGYSDYRPHVIRTLPEEYYVRDAKKQFLDVYGKVNPSAKIISPAAPDLMFQKDGQVLRQMFDTLFRVLERPAQFVQENGEVPPLPVPGEILLRDPRVPLEMKRLGFQDIDLYQAAQKTRFRKAYSSQFMAMPQLQGAQLSWYGVDAGLQDRYAWAEARKIHSPYRGQYYSTPDFYPRWPRNWEGIEGPWRGWPWIEQSRPREIALGDKLFSPFVAAGWAVDEVSNIRPAQWLGLLKHLAVVGAETYYTGHFNEGSGDSQFPDPRHYIWQAAMPAYAQAIASRFEDILLGGDVIPDPRRGSLRHWVGDPRILCTVRKDSRAERYVIAANLNPISNAPGNVEPEKQALLLLGADTLRILARRQGSVYVYDKSGKQPLFYQLDRWHEAEHPAYWSDTFHLEAEVFDNQQNIERSSAQAPGAEAGDYRAFDAWISAKGGNGWVEYQLEPREAGSYQAELRARCALGKPVVPLLLDGKPIGGFRLKAGDWQRFRLAPSGRKKGASARLPLGVQPHVLRLVLPPGVELDALIVSPEK